MEQTMKCGKVVDSQGKHIHVKFCPICSGEAEAKKNVNLDVIKDSKTETKTENLETISDSKIGVEATEEATKTENLDTDSDSKSEDDEESWGTKVLGVALLGLGLFIGLLYLGYKRATRKADNIEPANERETLSEWQIRQKQKRDLLTSATQALGLK